MKPRKVRKNTQIATLADVDAAAEELAVATAKGFENMEERFEAVDVRLGYIEDNMATKDDLRRFATKKDLEQFATKKDLEQFATKKDLDELADLVDAKFDKLIERFDAALDTFAAALDAIRETNQNLDRRVTVLERDHVGR